jgi:hypothetical protein
VADSRCADEAAGLADAILRAAWLPRVPKWDGWEGAPHDNIRIVDVIAVCTSEGNELAPC